MLLKLKSNTIATINKYFKYFTTCYCFLMVFCKCEYVWKPWADAMEPGVAGRKTNFCWFIVPRFVAMPALLGRAWTSVAIVTCPAEFFINKLVGCAEDDEATVVTSDWGGAGAIFVGVFVGALLTKVTFPPANFAPGFPVKRLDGEAVDEPLLAIVTLLITLMVCPYFKSIPIEELAIYFKKLSDCQVPF